MKICIRPALESEAGKLTEIAFAAKRHWQYPEAFIELWSDELTVSREYIQSHAVFCASVANEVTGWCALSFSGEACELDFLWVLPEKIGYGVGKAMIQHAKGVFSNSQAETMTVMSGPNAEEFYLKMEFVKVGMHPTKPKGRFLPVLSLRKELL